MRLAAVERASLIWLAAASFLVTGPKPSLADELMVPIASSGTWAAMEHRTSMTASPDVCVAFEAKSAVAMRSQDGDVEWRIVDADWSLPTDVKGSIVIKIGDWSEGFPIYGNDAHMVSAQVPGTSIEKMFLAMDKGSSMDITVGKDRKTVSLSGSMKVTNAFRTCAGITGAPSTGNNPFQ